MKYTLPVVMSLKTVSGVCKSGVGTFVVVNDEGWFVTAAHIIKQINDISSAEVKTRALEAQLGASANRQSRRSAKGPQPADIDKWSIYWGLPHAQIEDGTLTTVEPADLVVGRLKNFDSSLIAGYPIFKDPEKSFDAGASLCRLGFPFYDVNPTYDPVAGFRLNNFPLPIFPNEGILSRMQEIVLMDPTSGTLHAQAPPFPIRMIETSSAGIRGQSGGPIFDKKGAIWGIQSATTSYQMDLNTKEKQYYHVGVGVHAVTILGLFKLLGIKHEVSTH